MLSDKLEKFLADTSWLNLSFVFLATFAQKQSRKLLPWYLLSRLVFSDIWFGPSI
ncbi:hypothetical protein NC651_028627 [Populus alba x Populus x berolinensis]|nr:hypothetical protein NC651_028612 [Populus alba x Populus x berolinensis]KAJ6882060.1 hypothetical protein NC651_028617 [Populus alba x Populus x berolinensis]KAJ6882074.1 hypothetical protein NC651_028627 [Populus alba x Populus x berolinensis]